MFNLMYFIFNIIDRRQSNLVHLMRETNSINLTRERGPTKAYCVTLFMKCYIFIIF